jgi:hypothetical protein
MVRDGAAGAGRIVSLPADDDAPARVVDRPAPADADGDDD